MTVMAFIFERQAGRLSARVRIRRPHRPVRRPFAASLNRKHQKRPLSLARRGVDVTLLERHPNLSTRPLADGAFFVAHSGFGAREAAAQAAPESGVMLAGRAGPKSDLHGLR